MPRKGPALKRPLVSDPVYSSPLITQLVNKILSRGKKSTAESIVYGALEQIAKKAGADAVETFHKALGNIKPVVEVRSRRVGGATYQVPTEVRADRAQSLALRWLKEAAGNRSERSLSDRLANELLDAMQNRGAAVKKREDTHRMAEANKAFAHFRW